jgi:hypothetical protein
MRKDSLLFIKKITRFSIAMVLSCALNVYADINVELTLDRTSASLSDTVVLKIKVAGKRKSSPPEIKGLSAFDVVNGGSSSRMEIINGSISSSVEYTFYLTPLKPGDFVIGPARVKIKKKTYTSNSLQLTVSKLKKDITKNEKALFLKASVSSQELYVNQNTLYVLKLLRRERVSDISLEIPEVENLTFESLGEPKKYSTIINSRRYEVIELRYMLTPQKEGEYSIPAAVMRMTVYTKNRRQNLFQDPFFSISRGKPVYLASKAIHLTVAQLPALNRPDNFSGLVGRFEIKATLDPLKVKAGESATLTVTIKGAGNVRQIPDLKLPDVEELKLYQDKPALEIRKGESEIFGEKVMKWAIVPEKKGEYKIPVKGLSFFDPTQKRYRHLNAGPFKLTVVAIPGQDQNLAKLLNADKNGKGQKKNNKQTIERIGKDIFPVHTAADPLKGLKQQKFFTRIFIFLVLGPPFICLVLFCGQKFAGNNNKNRFVIRSKKAAKAFMKKMHGRTIPLETIHTDVLNYINTRFFLKGGLLTSTDIYDLLIERGVSSDTASKFRDLIAQLEAFIFTGQTTEPTDSIRKELTRAVKSIEQEVR